MNISNIPSQVYNTSHNDGNIEHRPPTQTDNQVKNNTELDNTKRITSYGVMPDLKILSSIKPSIPTDRFIIYPYTEKIPRYKKLK